MAQGWEYAELVWQGAGRGETREVVFSHAPEPWTDIKGDELPATLRRLGDAGWELVTVAHGRSSGLGVEAGKDVWHYFFKRPRVAGA